ncbi:cytochrome P450 [Pochonia chlamydosporia 170]|uniref:Cytochrome P450 n=1 Tax=Pochonia chlamydosporia 170 TaxID=1380566 RepID=A0A179G6B5_METCM|nr:cytochrome P450 [Pochonia chlamydosporia 170]OAQ73048.1 cytochrome P450 [Pochonia chlamydosporia 170]
MANWPITTIALTVTLLLVFQFSIRLYRQRRFFKDLPGPPHSFIWGHLPIMGSISALFPPNNHPQAYLTELSRRYNLPSLYYLDLWPIAPSQVVLSDPSLLEQVTVAKPLPQHQLSDDFLAPITGRNTIATANGAIWKDLHRAMVPAFSWSHIRSLTGVVVQECQLFREALDNLSNTGEVFSMEELGSKLTFDVIARVVFNVRLYAQTTGSVWLRDLREMIRLADGATDISVQFNPVARVRLWWKRRQVLGRLDPSIRAQVRERFALLKSEGVVPRKNDPDSILDLMLREKVASGLGLALHKSELSAEDEAMLVTNIKALLIGGQGTTTDSLCFIYMLLSKHPNVVQTLREEHTSLLQTHPLTISTLLTSPEKLQSLPYTEAVIKEALRLFPVGFGVRGASTGATLPFQGRDLPIDNDLGIVLNGHDVHYNEEYFPDPTAFKPERWLGDIPKSYFRTFGRGLRACLGQNLAVNELKIILVMTVRDFVFECVVEANERARCAHTDLDLVFGDAVFQELGLEAKPRGGMKMRVRRVGEGGV